MRLSFDNAIKFESNHLTFKQLKGSSWPFKVMQSIFLQVISLPTFSFLLSLNTAPTRKHKIVIIVILFLFGNKKLLIKFVHLVLNLLWIFAVVSSSVDSKHSQEILLEIYNFNSVRGSETNIKFPWRCWKLIKFCLLWRFRKIF